MNIVPPLALVAALALTACGPGAPNPYPEAARASFEQSCPPESAVCACTWDRITRALTYEEYEATLETFRTDGRMDPRVTRVRTTCLERERS